MVYDNVMRLCKERGVSKARLEKMANLANGTVASWQKSKDGMSVRSVAKVAQTFGVPIETLLQEDGHEY